MVFEMVKRGTPVVREDHTIERIGKIAYYLGMAEQAALRSTCLRRAYGAVIVKNDEIIATGYNGSARGEENCSDRGYCEREALQIPKGERYELCVAIHAEQNAIISASRKDMVGATMYIAGREIATGDFADGRPCLLCSRMLKNSGIESIVYRGTNGQPIQMAVTEL